MAVRWCERESESEGVLVKLRRASLTTLSLVHRLIIGFKVE